MIEDEGDMTLAFISKMPNIGDYRPKGYKLVDTLFVDKYGFGTEREPALTHGQLVQRVKNFGLNYGYAIIEEGEFQMVVGVFKWTEQLNPGAANDHMKNPY
jgi:hypothetical protein